MACGTNADGEGVWSWHPWAGAKPVKDDFAGDGDYKVMDTGASAQELVNTIAQGMPVQRLTCGELLVCFPICIRGHGCG